MTAITDGVLLERWIARKDAEAFNELITRHAGMVHGVCRRIARNDADAEDLAQDCFLKLAGVARAPGSSLGGWLHTVAARGALDLLRAGSRRRKRERRFAEDRARERRSGSPLSELRDEVDAAIAELPGRLREVIVAHFLERRTHEEVASSLGVSRQTVTDRIRKGIESLRMILKKRGLTASGAALSGYLGGLPVEAAPAELLASLGRLALSGGPAGAAPALSAASPTIASLAIANLGGLIMAKKLLLSSVAALVLVLLAGLAAFRTISERPEPLASVSTPMRSAGGDAAAGRVASVERRAAGRREEAVKAGGAPDALRTPLSGKVLDAEGRPVSGASVVAAAGSPGHREKLAETSSDDMGRFRLDAGGREEVRVWSWKSGVGLGVATGAGEALEVTLEPLSEVSGRTYDRETGEGIAGLGIRLSSSITSETASQEEADRFAARALFPVLDGRGRGLATSGDGSFTFQDLAPGRHRFVFDPNTSPYVLPGYRLDDSEPEVLLSAGERRSGIDFALVAGGSISGTVFGPDGEALPEAQVEVFPSYPVPANRAIRSGPDGTYRFIGLAAGGTYVVGATRAGLAPGESSTVAMAATEAIEGVDIHLVRGNQLSGRFIDDLGQPVGGIGVAIWKVSGSDRRGPGYGGTVTGDDGSFSFAQVAPGKHAVRPSSSLHLTGEPFPFTMPPDRDLGGLELVLRRKAQAPGFISGRVVDHEGKPVHGFPVNALLGVKAAATARSGEDGSFRLEGLGEAEVYVIAAYSAEYWSARRPAIPVYSTGVTLTVLKRGRILGRVVDAATGRPVEHFEARAVFIRTDPDGGENRFHLKWLPFDSRTGEFLIERAEPVDCEVQVRAEGYVEAKSARFLIPPGGAGEAVVSLSPGASVGGTVVDAVSGDPLAGALIRAHQHDRFHPWLLQENKPSYDSRGVWKLCLSKADGRFELGGLASGETIHLVAWKEGYGPSTRPQVAVGRGGDSLKIVMARAASLTVAASFGPREGKRFELHLHHRAEKPWRHAFLAVARAERPGPVEIPGLPPGPYRLAVYSVERSAAGKVPGLLGEERIHLGPGENQELPLDIDGLPGGFASVSVRVAGRGDPGRVLLDIVSEEDPEEPYAYAPAPPGPDGRLRFTGLPPGKYLIRGADRASEPAVEARLPVSVGAGDHRDLELTLR